MKTFLFLLLTFTSCIHAQQSPVYEEEVDDLFNKAYQHLYVHKDSASYYLKKIEIKATVKQDWPNVLDALISSNRNASYFYDLQTVSVNLKAIDQLIADQTNIWENIEDSLFFQNSINFDKGKYYYKIGDFEKAKTFFKRIYNSYDKINYDNLTNDHFELLSVSFSFLAKIYDLEGKLNLAKDYYLENVRLIKRTTPNDLNNLYINYALLADVLEKQGDIENANLYLRQTLNNALIENDNPNRIVTVSNNLANNHLSLGQPDSTLHYLSLIQKNITKSPHFAYLYHTTKAKLESTTGNTENAIAKIDMALTTYLKPRKLFDKSILSNIYKEKALFLYENKRYKKALDVTNTALDTLNSEFGPIYLELMALKAKSLLQLKKFETTNTVAFSAITSLDNFKPDYQYSSDKINLVESTFPLFESALHANYSLFEKTGDIKYLKRGFFLMEKSKSVLLMEALQASRANKFSMVPDSLLEKEKRLRIEITSLEKELKVSSSGDEELKNQIFEINQEQSKVINYISKNYPDYHKLRYGSKVTNLETLSNKITKDQTLINYFYGDNAIYAISIGHKEKKFTKIKNCKTITAQLKRYYALLSTPQSNLSDLNELSRDIYKKVLSPNLLSKTKRIIIIPDGPLNFLPFGTLINSKEEKKYLIERYAISYTNSATLLEQLWNTSTTKKNMLAFAPIFNGENIDPTASRDKLSALPHNTTEVQNIISQFEGTSLEGKNATLANFNANASNYGILHFATHAIFNNEQPEYSYLAFSPQKKEESLLYIKDLYNLELHANLVTLSACETTIGDLKRGEGFIGLARGFFYAGAKSLTSTLWKVNDASTANLMSDYYTILANGKPKDIALQKAKVIYLNKNKDNALTHPYYWSGFILSGDYAPLATGWSWVWIAVPILLLIILVTIFLTRKKLVQLLKKL
ncbi:CHAT domain-containing tetratricopeptide repeat protein [Maribacter sp.]|uniref:CHAT domain-containing protein n=1 Tax=Maribacter sp. TaxID=1897614 RepID=UPI0025BC7C15|nr:CHAT domain-containing tetratricopeptide repeat protein [Maribacter sp.]